MLFRLKLQKSIDDIEESLYWKSVLSMFAKDVIKNFIIF